MTDRREQRTGEVRYAGIERTPFPKKDGKTCLCEMGSLKML